MEVLGATVRPNHPAAAALLLYGLVGWLWG
jgi:hypothetical protein